MQSVESGKGHSQSYLFDTNLHPACPRTDRWWMPMPVEAIVLNWFVLVVMTVLSTAHLV